MIIGTTKELKPGETRVGLTPKWTKILTGERHKIIVEKGAGLGSGFVDEEYSLAGAEIVDSKEKVFEICNLVAKVKELQESEYGIMKKDQMIMTWFHLAEDVNPEMVQTLLDTKSIGLSMELIVTPDGRRPTIVPMSDIAGSLAVLEAVKYFQKINGGSGVILRKIYGLPTPKIAILGGGNAGINAAQVAMGLGLNVSLIEASLQRKDQLKVILPSAEVVMFEDRTVQRLMKDCDVFINCVYPSPGMKTPLIMKEWVRGMKTEAMIIDIAGAGIIETSHYTTLDNPIYEAEGIRHYCVDNMPALCPKTSTEALLMVSGPYIMAIANKGLKKAAEQDISLFRCISTLRGEIVHPEIGINNKMPYKKLELPMLDIIE